MRLRVKHERIQTHHLRIRKDEVQILQHLRPPEAVDTPSSAIMPAPPPPPPNLHGAKELQNSPLDIINLPLPERCVHIRHLPDRDNITRRFINRQKNLPRVFRPDGIARDPVCVEQTLDRLRSEVPVIPGQEIALLGSELSSCGIDVVVGVEGLVRDVVPGPGDAAEAGEGGVVGRVAAVGGGGAEGGDAGLGQVGAAEEEVAAGEAGEVVHCV